MQVGKFDIGFQQQDPIFPNLCNFLNIVRYINYFKCINSNKNNFY